MDAILLALFWFSVALLAYTYVGYPLALACLSRRRQPLAPITDPPSIEVLIAAYNEEGCIETKLRDTLALDYTGHLTITVVTDGSTDRTPELVRAYGSPRVRLLHQPERRGKSAALARGVAVAQGDVLLFTDANCVLAPGTAPALVRHLTDPQVGGVSGAKQIVQLGGATGEGLYWRYESWLKRLESCAGSVMGAPGEVWIARRAAYQAPPAGIILEDLYASIAMVARGWRVAYEPEAVSSEAPSPSLRAEWERRARVAAGGFQAVFSLSQVWRAGARTVFQFVSHRVLRWIVAPAVLALLLLWTVLLLPRPFFLIVLGLEGALCLAALAGWALAAHGRRSGWLALPFQAALLNGTALAGGIRYLCGHYTVLWPRVRE